MNLKQCVDAEVAFTGPGDQPPPGYGDELHAYHLAQIKARRKSTEWCAHWIIGQHQ